VQPVLETQRLLLRPYRMSDAPDLQRLAGDPRVADATAAIPHPYPDGAAEQWISRHGESFKNGSLIAYATTLRSSGELLGTVSLMDFQVQHARAELGYWIAVEHWGKGYCTEAVTRLVSYAREQLKVSRIVARCLVRNPASARVLEKIGLHREGVLRKHDKKNGRFEDVLVYGVIYPERGDA
jgi:[ribosomal protein S5]-alanine N-acetyltransferase